MSSLRIPRKTSSILNAGRDRILLIKEFVHEVHEFIGNGWVGKLGSLNVQELEQLKLVITAIDYKNQKKDLQEIGLDPKAVISERVFEFAKHMTIIPHQKSYLLAEMTLVSIVSQLESVIKTYLIELLSNNPVMMRTAASITLEKVLSYKSMPSLHRSVAEDDVGRMMHGGMDDVADFFNDRLKISISTFPEWWEIYENSHRRNVIVHNDGRIDEKYRRKLKSRPNLVVQPITLDYVSDAASRAIAFLDFMHAEVKAKSRA